MPKPPLTPDAAALFAEPNPAVMATVHPDGHPVTVATWYLFEDGRLVLNLDGSRARLKHLRANPAVSLTALAEGDWYTHVSVQGRVVEIRDDEGLADIDRVSRHYTGSAYPNRESPRVTVVVEIEHWHGWGAVAK
ncbi:TIGR03618 family F420-dependent PPOX class oxidoreductase [Kineococcus rhizosphaerae]|uniref:PPOX class probable F420-dependent enzyme n=1 Tax=Kineococcus rhizosphaerae TaxID=559628 RepID=A0A2T0R178_9ACTN|nr:TIGR03618 family F420-dependent PPOX class oxidoreductase [Kineococcus rhizosphaerae]PRY13001.1 PPOX class probable F420-dependent enzyme [Kineococcus rhizosphaerae]